MKRFNIASFNLYNLVLPEKKYYDRKYSHDQYAKKKEWVARQLDTIRSQVVGFQEVFHAEALKEVVQASNYLKGANVLVAEVPENIPQVGLATKFKVLSQQTIIDFPEPLDVEGLEVPIRKFRRPVLKATLRINKDISFIVYVAHLKSKRPDVPEGRDPHDPFEKAKGSARSLIRRASEANALRQLLMEDLLKKKQPVILLGDLNDVGMSVTTRMISDEPPHRKYPMEVKKQQWDILLYHARDIQARQSYYNAYFTHIHNGHHEMLDHILVSEELVRENPKHIGSVEYFRCFNDHLVDSTLSDDKVPVWMSDHGQAVASIELEQGGEKRGQQKTKKP